MRYFGRYVLMNEFYKRLHPFQFLKEGSYAVHVGFHDKYIDLGISYPLIMSVIVGSRGHVWAIDPDRKNADTLARFIKVNKIDNLTVINKALWKEKGKLDFCFFKDFTSSNIAVPLADRFKERLKKRWGDKRIKKQSYIRTVKVDTLDSIIAGLTPSPAINFINLTVNGAESDIIRGARKTINANPDMTIGFPLANISPSTYAYLRSLKHKIVVADAHQRPWEKERFLYGCAVKCSHQRLISSGFKKTALKTINTL